MRNGFSLIEMVVAVGIVIVLVGVGVNSVSRFNSRDKIVAAKSEVMSILKMTKNYAMTLQSPTATDLVPDAVGVILNNATNRQLSVVPVVKISDNKVFDIGNSYFTTTIKDTELQILFIGGTSVIFSAPEGKIVDIGGTPVDSGLIKTITITANGTGEIGRIIINSLGVISE